jgi:hypothetical protein
MKRQLAAVLCVVCLIPGVVAAQSLSSDEAKAWREDLRFMAQAMETTHKNLYHAVSRDAFAAMVAALDARVPTLARHEVIVEMAKIVATVGDGHTNIYPTRDPTIGFHTLPVAFTFFNTDLYVRSVHDSQRYLLGARVVRIGNRSTAEAFAAAKAIIGRDNEYGARFWAPFLLAMPEVLHALHLTDTLEDVAIAVVTVTGREESVVLHSFAPVEVMSGDTVRAFERRQGWTDARHAASGADPLWLSRTGDAFWFEPVGGLLYVQINQIADARDETLAHFAERLRAEIDRTHPDKVAIDLRLNRGGNGGLNAAVVRALVQSRTIDRKDRLFAIIGPATFSAAQMLVDALARYTNITFVGEPTGSKGNAYGDSFRITLPNSGMTVRASLYYWQEWHPLDSRDATSPSIPAPMTMDAYRANRDPAVEAIIRVPVSTDDQGRDR